jgi:hypothetical protein
MLRKKVANTVCTDVVETGHDDGDFEWLWKGPRVFAFEAVNSHLASIRGLGSSAPVTARQRRPDLNAPSSTSWRSRPTCGHPPAKFAVVLSWEGCGPPAGGDRACL